MIFFSIIGGNHLQLESLFSIVFGYYILNLIIYKADFALFSFQANLQQSLPPFQYLLLLLYLAFSFLMLVWMSNKYFHYATMSVKFQLFTHFTVLVFAIYEKALDKLMISLHKLILVVRKMITPCCFLSFCDFDEQLLEGLAFSNIAI